MLVMSLEAFELHIIRESLSRTRDGDEVLFGGPPEVVDIGEALPPRVPPMDGIDNAMLDEQVQFDFDAEGFDVISTLMEFGGCSKYFGCWEANYPHGYGVINLSNGQVTIQIIVNLSKIFNELFTRLTRVILIKGEKAVGYNN